VRALAVLGQRHVHVGRRNRRLRRVAAVRERDRIPQAADADLVDGEMALVRPRLRVGDRDEAAGCSGAFIAGGL
jgi:hypothetical protein